ncbi:restriction endonuclease subunit S [Pseudoxanthomonas sacheonensis]|uniref:restriction endonuclease subunit S n=1 Tax=Pseudoxanthomonas sacheonensis TaxID=443615 RepID=UPI0013D1BCF3|nr:restriction endonuclease subunit S [Pseudoxanthomonas sacheonensis]KAF1707473.1 S-CspCI protein [Pseudoxanthomonas sacheonensis]
MKKLNELFNVAYGNKLDFNKMKQASRRDGGINFVGRSSQNHGVTGTVAPIATTPYEAGLITVALGGTKLLCSFVQEHAFYTAQNVAVLKPKKAMSFAEKLFICISIRHNRFKYSAFGREANRTLRELLVPDLAEFPSWVEGAEVDAIGDKALPRVSGAVNFNTDAWRPFPLSALFYLRKGRRLTKAQMTKGETPFIGAIDGNNGISARIGQHPIHDGNTITVNYNGSVAEAFYQEVPFWASDDVNVLYPKFEMTPAVALFLTTVIRREKYRFNYGRKWHLERMSQSEIRLPANSAGEVDFAYMQSFMDSLPYSSQVA